MKISGRKNITGERVNAMAAVNAAAENKRLSISPHAIQHRVYEIKLREAEAFLRDPSLTTDDTPLISNEALYTGRTREETAKSIREAYAHWLDLIMKIEAERFRANSKIQQSIDVKEMRLIADDFAAEIDLIG